MPSLPQPGCAGTANAGRSKPVSGHPRPKTDNWTAPTTCANASPLMWSPLSTLPTSPCLCGNIQKPRQPSCSPKKTLTCFLFYTMLEAQGHWNVVRRPDGQMADIRPVVIDFGRLVGSHPNSRQPFSGAKKSLTGARKAQLGNPGAGLP